MSENPYSPPRTEMALPPDPRGELHALEQVRKEHLSHEARTRGVALFFFLPCAALTCASLVMLMVLADILSEPLRDLLTIVGLSLVCGLSAVLFGWVGWGLRQLSARVRIPATILSILMLLWLPLGTLVGGYTLWTLHSAKGRMVFSPEYAEIRELTPHLRYRSSRVVWFFLVALVSTVLSLVALALL